MLLSKLIYRDFTRLTVENLAAYKRLWSKSLGATPKNSQILHAYRQLLKQKRLKPTGSFEQMLRIKRVRSLSGVTALAVMTEPFYCPGQCIYCPLEAGMPKSYLSDEPAAQRAKSNNFDPFLQIKDRLRQLKETGHQTEKIELIVIGGTFSVYPKQYKLEFFKRIYDACNGQESRTLIAAQKLNEKAKHRVVGISIETRPDRVEEAEIKLWRKLGVTKIQLGVQAFDAAILKRIKRGHSLAAVSKATLLLKNSGFKICYHFMPNLPGSSPDKDVIMAKIMYHDSRFKPDFVKIYPTQVLPDTVLFKIWKAGKYKTYTFTTIIEVLKRIKLITPPWVRIDRLVRDISKGWIASGISKSNLRQIIQEQLKKEGRSCSCIRCREIKQLSFRSIPKLMIQDIKVKGAKEYFLSYERNNRLYSMLRLRFPQRNQRVIFPELKNSGLVRELHTFGIPVPFTKRAINRTQHQGLGRSLLKKAEAMSRSQGFAKIAVIAAVGTRDYYRKLGYKLRGYYMIKEL